MRNLILFPFAYALRAKNGTTDKNTALVFLCPNACLCFLRVLLRFHGFYGAACLNSLFDSV
jgi:hypothetical protein